MRPIMFIASFLAFIFGITVLFGSWYTVDEGERAVLTRNGAVIGVAEPGLGFKLPFIDSARKITVRTEMVSIDSLEAYSKDQQAATMKVTVNFRVMPDQAVAVYTQYGSVEALARRIILPRVNEELKTVFGQYTAMSAIQSRDKLNADVRAQISKAVEGPIIVEGVQIENIDFSEAYEGAIEARMQAEVEVQKSQQQALNAAALADKARAEAQGAADSNLALAKASAEGVRLQGEAEAASIRAKGMALRDNPALLQYQAIGEGWDGQLPKTMVPGSTLPFLSIK